jgi:hypothetical protein
MSHDDLITTKWGRITSQQWLRKRQQEELDRCMGPEQMHYVFLGIPFRDANGVEIVDHEFRALLQDDRDAAMSQLECEFHADRARQGQRAAWNSPGVKRPKPPSTPLTTSCPSSDDHAH